TGRVGERRSERVAAVGHQPLEQLPHARRRHPGHHPHRRPVGVLVPEPGVRARRIVTMNAAYIAGLRSAVRQWRLCLVVFAVGVAAALCFSVVTWVWLSAALDNAVPTRTLLNDLDMDVFVDLWAHHGESLQMLLVTGGVAAVFFGVLSIWLN